uniref:DHFR domain-containing protein n=1 Tax=viral metagenome TaxID=1070528 RepID=A0A6C0B5R5_9ZZZZ
MSKKIIGIACLANNRAIGNNNTLIFSNKEDMKFFTKTTIATIDKNKKNAVIMGRKTFYTLKRLLKGRINCVLTHSDKFLYDNTMDGRSGDLYIYKEVDKLLQKLNNDPVIETIYVIGGATIYKYFSDNNLFDTLILSIVKTPIIDYGDVFFPEINLTKYYIKDKIEINNKGREITSGSKCDMNYNIYYLNKKTHKVNEITDILDSNIQEYQYLNLLEKILTDGEVRETRNSKTISLFGVKMQFDISQSFPLLTTKKMYWKGILKELLWFINANTNSKDLEKDKVRIWQGNSTREYLDSIGLTQYEEGDCGPIYGFQWRHFNAKYRGHGADYTGEGVDQLQNIIDLIRTNPNSRRMYMTAWNPCQLKEMALPPCHISYQFYVRKCSDTGKRFLDCMMYQRSGDIFLGVPFNIASTATLTYIIANATDIHPGKINIVIGDAHIYENHIEQVKTQLGRTPYTFPTLVIKKKIDDIDNIIYDDFEIDEYTCHPGIKAEMVP